MATYTIDNRPTRLKNLDRVIFVVNGETYTYEAHGSYMELTSPEDNDTIFTLLGLDKVEFCRKHYGEKHVNEPLNGDWPELMGASYAAMCRVVNALYDLLPKIKVIKIYETEDGQRFDTEAEAIAHLCEVEFINWCDERGMDRTWAVDVLAAWKVARR